MHKPNAPASLAELSAAGVRLRPYEVVTIVRELVLRLSRGELAGMPSPHVVRLCSSGDVTVEGPVGAGRDPIARAATLLDSLLPGADAGPQFRVPGGLRLVLGRALGTLDLPPFATLNEFADALARFAATDPAATITSITVALEAAGDADRSEIRALAPPRAALVAQIQPFVANRTREAACAASHSLADEPLTVSDIRRARRATGVRLDVIAERSRIALPLLRQLEWGYLLNWPVGQEGRTQLARYARAAGLDEELVLSAMAPLIEEVESGAHHDDTVTALVRTEALPPLAPADILRIETELVPVGHRLPRAVTASTESHDRTMLALLAVPAVAALALLPFVWTYSSPPEPAHQAATATVVAKAGTPESPAVTATSGSGTAAAVSAPAKAGAAPPLADRIVEDEAATPRAKMAGTSPTKTAGTSPTKRVGTPVAYRPVSDGVSYSPAYDNAGTAMFYQVAHDGASSLVRADTDSRGAVLKVTKIVDDPANNYHVRPSPDGSRIAFDSDREGERGVYVADADGRHVRRVSPEGFASVPSWSPDGTSLAFVRADPDRPNVWNLWTLNLETGALKQITKRTYGQPWGGSWFPDGQRIAYSHEERLIVHDLRTGSERVFPTPKSGHLVRTPAVSPDGRRIMFQVRYDGAWMLELGDSSMRRILEDPTAEEYTWAPDGKRVAYHSRKSGEWGVWVMAAR